ATPATMLALLQVIALGWRERDLSVNAERVQGLAIQLVKRIGTLTGHLSEVGRSLERAVQAHNQAVGSYESRLLVTARQLGDLGIAGAGELAEPHRVDGAPRQPAHQVLSATSAEHR
ncbi:MAG: DNA recombination protein RmuC, partial [Thermoanaerobaculia bacterium]